MHKYVLASGLAMGAGVSDISITPDDPPTLILHGTSDTTVDYDQSVELDSDLTQAGIYSDLHLPEGIGHTFDLQPSGYELYGHR